MDSRQLSEQARIKSAAQSSDEPRTVAVIDVGTNSIRMAVAEIRATAEIRRLAAFAQPVNLGHDTFKTGAIRRSTIEQCVRVLNVYQEALQEFRVTNPDQIRVVATSAVREARNRLTFVDRIYIGTGLLLEPIDEAEVSRITYLGIHPFLRGDSPLAQGQSMVVELGGGSTELLVARDGDVAFASTFRLGSVRLRVALEPIRAKPNELKRMMQNQIQRTVDLIHDRVTPHPQQHLVTHGGDVRFAANQLVPDWQSQRLVAIPLEALESLTDQILKMKDDDLVQRYHLPYPDAETLGASLLAYVLLARRFELENIWVSDVNLRDGMLQEMAVGDVWTDDFRRQVVRFAMTVARRYEVDERHARHVADLARQLFTQLDEIHHLESRYEVILYIAALLHEVGSYVNTRSLHKHSMYLIDNSELFGLGQKDQLLLALVARYHRRASPQPNHEGYSRLGREDRIIVSKLAAILRIAIALDESRSGRVQKVTCEIEDERVVMNLQGIEDLALEQLAVRQQGHLFDEVFGRSVLLRGKPS